VWLASPALHGGAADELWTPRRSPAVLGYVWPVAVLREDRSVKRSHHHQGFRELLRLLRDGHIGDWVWWCVS